MRTRIGLWAVIALLATPGPGAAQGQYGQAVPPRPPVAGPTFPAGQTQESRPPQHPAAQPGYPASQPYPAAPAEALMPRDPTLHRRTAERIPGAPFALTPQQQADVDGLMARWEQHGAGIKTFECKFTRFDWDPVWKPDQPMHILEGEIRYAAPDKGMFRVDGELVDFRWENPQAVGGRFVKGQQAEHWICDGKSVFEYNFPNKQLIEHKLPPELRGRAISDSPLPFLFGARADQLKERYFLRIVTPPAAKNQVWLEVYPKYQADAANFQRATLILTLGNMQPSAVEMVLPNGKSREVYHFQNPKMNVKNLLDPLGVFENNWLHPRTPPGWTKIVEEPPQVQASRVPAPDARR